MSLSEDPTLSLLQSKFVCGWKNISGESYCGRSGHYSRDGSRLDHERRGPARRPALSYYSADGTVLHCLPGFWETHDLAHEIKFAEDLNRVWMDRSLSRTEKDAKFKEMNLKHVDGHPQEMVARSQMQGFDKKFEEKRSAVSDCLVPGKEGKDHFKTTDRILHERMATRPFVSYDQFDVAKFSDYGRPKYDKKKGIVDAN